MSFDDSRAVWTQFGVSGGWLPEEHPGWWLLFDSVRSPNFQGYGPFPTREDADGYLEWARTEATITRAGGPAIVVALRSAERVKVIEVGP